MQTATFISCELIVYFFAGPTMKIRRHVVHKKYSAAIEAMYSETPALVKTGHVQILHIFVWQKIQSHSL